MRRAGKIVAALVGAAVLGGGAALALHMLEQPPSSDTATVRYAETISGCKVTDGDTIRCGDERIRLLGIDAPELPGHCRAGRNCAPGDPYASTSSLSAAMTGQLTIKRVDEDHYGRTLAMVAGSQGDLSCWQLKHDQVIYRSDWDNGLNVARTCPADIM
jgi:micrococcal nuclease